MPHSAGEELEAGVDRVARAVLVVVAAASVGLLVLTLQRREFYSASTFQFYVGASVALLLLVARGLTWGPRRRIPLVLLLGGASVACYSMETALWLLSDTRSPAELRAARAAERGVPFDGRTPRQLLANYRRSGEQAYPGPLPVLWTPTNGLPGAAPLFPLAGVSRHTTVLCNESGSYVVYPADEHGFRNPPGSWARRPVDSVLIGDSYTHGVCVEEPQSVAGYLRASGQHLLNLGISSSGPLTELAILREYAEALRPARVYWLYFEFNDLGDLYRESRSELLLRYLEDEFSQGLIGRQAEIDAALAAYFDKAYRKEETPAPRRNPLLDLLRLRRLLMRVGAHSDAQGPSPLDLFERVLRAARRRVEAWGGEIHFVYLPDFYRYRNDLDEEDARQRGKVLEIVRRSGIPLLDLHPVFAAHSDVQSLFPAHEAGHYGPEGYALLAELILGRPGLAGRGG